MRINGEYAGEEEEKRTSVHPLACARKTKMVRIEKVRRYTLPQRSVCTNRKGIKGYVSPSHSSIPCFVPRPCKTMKRKKTAENKKYGKRNKNQGNYRNVKEGKKGWISPHEQIMGLFF
uniref:Uncharacterized protein n=1 Tax=Trypanosoma congolense (strain IL3000) TaxID=1068625 RepID=G0US96_TRYCI|nr:hypothetical protein, unlikely [Trypanosoma congolense IL3000]